MSSDKFVILIGVRQGSIWLLHGRFDQCYYKEEYWLQSWRSFHWHSGVCKQHSIACATASSTAVMVGICSSYDGEHNLLFSTNVIPSKSKSQCLIFSATWLCQQSSWYVVFVRRPSVSQLSQNLLSRFLSNFSCGFRWDIPPAVFFFWLFFQECCSFSS